MSMIRLLSLGRSLLEAPEAPNEETITALRDAIEKAGWKLPASAKPQGFNLPYFEFRQGEWEIRYSLGENGKAFVRMRNSWAQHDPSHSKAVVISGSDQDIGKMMSVLKTIF